MDEMNPPPSSRRSPPPDSPAPPSPTPPPRPDYLQPAFWAGVCSGVLTGVPGLSLGFCLWMTGGGTLAVYFFKLMNGFPLRRGADGARLGMLTGMFSFLVWSVVSLLSNVLINRGFWNYVNAFNEQLQTSMPNDPQTREFLAWFSTTDGLITMLVFMSLAFLTVHVLLATLGGATGVRTFNNEKPD
jgi:hypothetical protein